MACWLAPSKPIRSWAPKLSAWTCRRSNQKLKRMFAWTFEILSLDLQILNAIVMLYGNMYSTSCLNCDARACRKYIYIYLYKFTNIKGYDSNAGWIQHHGHRFTSNLGAFCNAESCRWTCCCSCWLAVSCFEWPQFELIEGRHLAKGGIKDLVPGLIPYVT